MWLVNLGDTAVTFHRTLHTSSGAISSGDAIPEFSVFQGTATAAVWAATMVVTDSTGFYRGTFTCVSCTGFTAGLYGSIKVRGVVSGTSGEAIIPFMVVPTTLPRVGSRLCAATSDGTTTVQAGLISDLHTWTSGIQSDLRTWTSGVQTAVLVGVSSASSSIQTFTSGVQTAVLTGVSSASSSIQTFTSGVQTQLIVSVSSASSSIQTWTSGIQTNLRTWTSGIQSDLRTWSSGIQSNLRTWTSGIQTSIESTIAPQVAGIVGTDTTGVPAATATWVRKVDWLYGWHTNRQTFNRTNGLGTVYNASTIAIATFNASDDGTTFVRPKASS